MKRIAAVVVCALALLVGSATSHAEKDSAELAERVGKAREVYRELTGGADREIPKALLDECDCVAVFPGVIKAAIGFGGRYGKGVVTCRNSAGRWSPLAFFRLTGGSWGLQLGAESTDLVLFIMSERGARSLLESKFTLGGKLSVAAGPAGRSAEASTDAKFDAEIYSYARSRGLFAGLSLEGARLAPDGSANRGYYGTPVSARAILFDHEVPRRPADGDSLLGALPGKP